MSQLNLSIATTDYDHFRDLRMGLVRPEGIDLNWMTMGHHECFARFTANREFDLAPRVTLTARGGHPPIWSRQT